MSELVAKPIEEHKPKEKSSGYADRNVILADLEKEKKASFIKAWEESEKSKAENKAQKKISKVHVWEINKKAAIEAQLRKIEEKLERNKAENGEKMKNKLAAIHIEAKEKKAMVEAKTGEELLKTEETTAKSRATGIVPKATCGRVINMTCSKTCEWKLLDTASSASYCSIECKDLMENSEFRRDWRTGEERSREET